MNDKPKSNDLPAWFVHGCGVAAVLLAILISIGLVSYKREFRIAEGIFFAVLLVCCIVKAVMSARVNKERDFASKRLAVVNMSARVKKERVLARKRRAEVKRFFAMSPQEFFNPMGFNGLQWLVTGFGFSVALIVLAVLLHH